MSAIFEYLISSKDKTKGGLDSAERGLTGFQQAAESAASAISAALAGITFAAVIKGIQEVTEAYAVQESAEHGLETAIRNNPYLDGSAAARMMDYASAIQQTSVYGDEVIIQQQSMLAAMNLTEDQINKVTNAAVNLASSGLVTIDSAFRNLARQYSGMTGELGELIPALRELDQEQLKAGEGIDVIAAQYAGFAETLRSDTRGQIESLKNSFGDLKEALGEAINPASTWVVSVAQAAVDKWTEAFNKINDYMGAIGKTKSDDASIVLQGLEEEYKVGRTKLDSLKSELTEARDELKDLQETFGSGPIFQARSYFKQKAIDELKVKITGQEESLKIMANIIEQQQEIVDLQTANIPQIEIPEISNIADATEAGAEATVEAVEDLSGWLAMMTDALTTIRDERSADDGGMTEMTQIISGAATALSLAFGSIYGAILPVIQSLQVVAPLIDIVGTYFAGVFHILGPAIDSILIPVLGWVLTIGEFLGHILLPLLNVFAPVVDMLLRAAVMMYNAGIVPFANGLIWALTLIENGVVFLINGIIKWVSQLTNKKYRLLDYRDPRENYLTEISTEDLKNKGESFISGDYTTGGIGGTSTTLGTAAQYTAGRTVNQTVNIYTDAIAGDGGLRQLAIMIRDEIFAAEALGA